MSNKLNKINSFLKPFLLVYININILLLILFLTLIDINIVLIN